MRGGWICPLNYFCTFDSKIKTDVHFIRYQAWEKRFLLLTCRTWHIHRCEDQDRFSRRLLRAERRPQECELPRTCAFNSEQHFFNFVQKRLLIYNYHSNSQCFHGSITVYSLASTVNEREMVEFDPASFTRFLSVGKINCMCISHVCMYSLLIAKKVGRLPIFSLLRLLRPIHKTRWAFRSRTPWSRIVMILENLPLSWNQYLIGIWRNFEIFEIQWLEWIYLFSDCRTY